VSGPTSPRLAPLPPEQWDDDVREALAAAFTDEGAARLLGMGPAAISMPNVLATLMHHPALAGPFLVYNNVLLRSPTLDARLRELMILRVAWRTGSRYEWAQHLRIAASVGITPEEIDAVAQGTDAVGWPALDGDVITAVDELVDGYRITDDTWNRLAEQLDERQLVELVFVAGTYTGLAMAFNSFGLELDADLPTTPVLPRTDIDTAIDIDIEE
jgi:4-carboxymuconolactone decarboxylase